MATASTTARPAARRSRRAARGQALEARRQAYRELVLRAAGEAFARDGVAQTRMETLAEESGLSLGTLYSVYKGKSEIVDALHESHLREIHAASIAAEALEAQPLHALLAGSRAYIAYFLAHPDYLRMHLDEGTNWGVRDAMDRESRSAAVWNDGVERLAEIFQQGIDAGVFAPGPADRLARMMLAMQQVQLADWIASGMETEPDVLMTEVERLLRRAFCTNDFRD